MKVRFFLLMLILTVVLSCEKHPESLPELDDDSHLYFSGDENGFQYQFNWSDGRNKAGFAHNVRNEKFMGLIKGSPIYGILTSSNLSYIGRFNESSPNGRNEVLIYPHGVWVGNVRNGSPDGEGVFVTTNYVFRGVMRNYKYEEFGALLFDNGKSYLGQFENGEYSGTGIMHEVLDDDVYRIKAGSFLNGNMNSYGVIVYPVDESYLFAEFTNGFVRNGYSVSKAGNTNLWENGKIVKKSTVR